MLHPRLIQGSPDLALSTWPLARAVAQAGGLGVITGAVLPALLARRLQLGDLDGHLRSVLDRFPFPGAARRVWEQFFVPGGKSGEQPFELVSQPHLEENPALVELTVFANFAEVLLAKDAHRGPVGVQYHDSARLALLPSLYGALLAGADYLLVEAGGVRAVAPALARLVAGQSAAVEIPLADARAAQNVTCGFDPHSLGAGNLPALKQPAVLAFCRDAAQAVAISTDSSLADGFILETPAGSDWPVEADVVRCRGLGRPFWIAGVAGTPGKLRRALAAGANGLQISTAFTFCAESALDSDLKRRVLTLLRQDPNNLFSRLASLPTGRSFRVLRLEDTTSDPETAAARARLCDVGWFREVYRRPDGSLGYRCPGEPLHHYVLKGGLAAAAARQPCVCNGMLAGLGLAQVQDGHELEKALIPVGDDIREVRRFLKTNGEEFTAADVVRELTGPESEPGPYR